MSNHFNKVTIENFKSIKKIDFDCKRINLFLGEPNVGKSNILEAMGLFSAPFSYANNGIDYRKLNNPINNTDFFFAWDQIRYNNIRNLFNFHDTSNPISVHTNIGVVRLQLTILQQEIYEFFIASNKEQIDNFNQTQPIHPLSKRPIDFEPMSSNNFSPNYYLQLNKFGGFDTHNITFNMSSYAGFVKKYVFNETLFKGEREHNKYPYSLMPSYGSNLFTIVHEIRELEDLVAGFFDKYEMELSFIYEKSEYVLQRRQGRVATLLPFDSVADTLQRIIFHLAAIYSNKDSVLIFEEPESHSFPDYIQLLATKIIDSKSNQFFITTHSPYLVQKLLQGLNHVELSVNAVGYKDQQTVIKPISSEETDKMIDRGSDIFFNLPQF